MYYMGNFVGPTFGGILVDYYGFRATTVVVFCSYCLSVAVDLIYLFFKISSELKVQKKPHLLKYQPLMQVQRRVFNANSQVFYRTRVVSREACPVYL